MIRKETILVCDDDDVLRNRLEKAFINRNFKVYVAANYDEAIELASAEKPSKAVLDLKMPGKSGLELLKDILAASPETRCVMLTGYGSITNAVDAVKIGRLLIFRRHLSHRHSGSTFSEFLPKRAGTFPKRLVGWIFLGERCREN